MKDIIQIKDLVFSYKHNENTEDRKDSKTVNRKEVEMKRTPLVKRRAKERKFRCKIE